MWARQHVFRGMRMCVFCLLLLYSQALYSVNTDPVLRGHVCSIRHVSSHRRLFFFLHFYFLKRKCNQEWSRYRWQFQALGRIRSSLWSWTSQRCCVFSCFLSSSSLGGVPAYQYCTHKPGLRHLPIGLMFVTASKVLNTLVFKQFKNLMWYCS